MTKWLSLPLAALLLWPAPIAAQEEMEQEHMQQEKMEQEGPTWWAVISEQIKPAMADQYGELAKEWVEMVRAHASEDLQYYTLSGMETGYLYAIPMKSLGSFVEMDAKWRAMIEKIGRDKWMEMSKRSDEAVEHRTMAFYVERADLSYKPETPRMSLDEMPMRHYDWLYVTPGMEMEAEGVMKEWVELYKANNVDSGWTVYQAVTGENLPAYVTSTPAASMVDYLTDGERIDEMLGEADEALWSKTTATMRDFKHNNAWMRPELSLIPEE